MFWPCLMQGHRGGGGGGGGEGGRGRVGGGGRAHTCIMTHMAGNGGKRRLPGVRTAAGSERKINKASANVHVRGEGRDFVHMPNCGLWIQVIVSDCLIHDRGRVRKAAAAG